MLRVPRALQARRLVSGMPRRIQASARRCSSMARADQASPRCIMFFASEVAAAVRLNPFKAPFEVLEEVWRRTCPEQYQAVADALSGAGVRVLPAEERAKELATTTGVGKILEAALDDVKKAKGSSAVSQLAKRVVSAVRDTELDQESQQELTKYATSALYTEYGRENEARAIRSYEQASDSTVRDSNVEFFHKPVGQVGRSPGMEVAVGGRVDGLTADRVVEVKNRIRGLKRRVPVYDVVQLQAYMYIVGRSAGELVERAKYTARGAPTLRTTVIRWDQEFWEQHVRQPLLAFAELVHYLASNPAAQRRLLAARSRDEKLEVMQDLEAEAIEEARREVEVVEEAKVDRGAEGVQGVGGGAAAEAAAAADGGLPGLGA